MTELVKPIAEISRAINDIQKAESSADLSAVIARVESLLNERLKNPQDADFGQAVILQFSFLDALKAKEKITAKQYQQTCLAKIERILALNLKDSDLRSYLDQKRVAVAPPQGK